MNDRELIRIAFEAREKAYTPYSHFRVGAALLCADGTVYGGCNIENAAFSPTNCAERTAFFKAVYDGHRDFRKIVVVGKSEDSSEYDYCAPCGVCRQVMAEFCDPEEFEIVLARSEEDFLTFRLKDLLPLGFTKESLTK